MYPGSKYDFTLTDWFYDPDGDALTFSATSSDSSVLEVSCSDDLITFTVISSGIVTLTVTASDGRGGTVSHLIIGEVF